MKFIMLKMDLQSANCYNLASIFVKNFPMIYVPADGIATLRMSKSTTLTIPPPPITYPTMKFVTFLQNITSPTSTLIVC